LSVFAKGTGVFRTGGEIRPVCPEAGERGGAKGLGCAGAIGLLFGPAYHEYVYLVPFFEWKIAYGDASLPINRRIGVVRAHSENGLRRIQSL
jgi:hypothetical protein